jgi:hypothetical protein
MNTVEAYRKAAIKLFGANPAEAEQYIVSPQLDTGEWATDSMVIIYLERDGRFQEDQFAIPNALGYHEDNGFANCLRIAQEAGVGYVEYINCAVAAVWPA